MEKKLEINGNKWKYIVNKQQINGKCKYVEHDWK